jgi:hypothetical protein
MSIRLPTAVDVLITAVSPGTSKDEVATALLRHTEMNAVRATEVAGLILAGQQVQIELHSQQTANLLAQDLRNMGATVTVKI